MVLRVHLPLPECCLPIWPGHGLLPLQRLSVVSSCLILPKYGGLDYDGIITVVCVCVCAWERDVYGFHGDAVTSCVPHGTLFHFIVH